MAQFTDPIIRTAEQLDDRLSDPPQWLVDRFRDLPGDLIVLGVAGKMGPTLARMAKRASDQAGTARRVIGVARFSDEAERGKLDGWGIETIKCDLLDEAAVAKLPDAPHVVYMAGMKFGSTGAASLTWAMNTHLPAVVCKRYQRSRIVAFSTGNVYGLAPMSSGGSVESDALNPQGEYAMSCLGRERMVEHFSRTLNIPTAIIRLNYACELRYGVLVDLAQRIQADQPIDLTMGYANVIWQADANAMSLAALADAASPPYILNVAGPETLSVQRVCEQLARRMGKQVTFTGEPSTTAILSNGQFGHQRYGYPSVSAGQLIDWIADWVGRGGKTLGKPTKFEVRDGKF